MILIGSRAAKIHFPEFRNPKDYDFIASEQEIKKFLSKFKYRDTSTTSKKVRARIYLDSYKFDVEFDVVERCPSSALIYKNDRVTSYYDCLLDERYHVASPEVLFLLKKSHIIFNIHWNKNIEDYLFLKDKVKNKFSHWQNDALKLRFDEIKNRLKFREMNFDLKNSEFFKKSEPYVNRIIEHDAIHKAICFYDKPLFLYAKDDLTKATLSKDKVRQMSKLHKIRMIQEEAMVLSLERHIIPCWIKKIPFDKDAIYKKMAGKMVYHYLPVFMRYFAADHFNEIVNLHVEFTNKFLRNISDSDLHKLL